MEADDTVSFNITSDPELIQQYQLLRHRIFAEARGIEVYPKGEDAFDQDSVVVVAMQHGKVVGGIRGTIHQKGSATPLPLEKLAKKSVSELLPEIPCNDLTYMEVGGMVLEPHLRDPIGQNVFNLFTKITSVINEKNIDLVLSPTRHSFAKKMASFYTVRNIDYAVRKDVTFLSHHEAPQERVLILRSNNPALHLGEKNQVNSVNSRPCRGS